MIDNFNNLEDDYADNTGNLMLPLDSKWQNIVTVLIKNGYIVKAYKSEYDYIHINYSERQ